MNQVGRYTQGHFENLLAKYDANNDGALDNSDVSKLKAQGASESAGKGILAVLTGGLSALATGFDSKGGEKANELQKMLGRDPNGRIDQNDVLRPRRRRHHRHHHHRDRGININIDKVIIGDRGLLPPFGGFKPSDHIGGDPENSSSTNLEDKFDFNSWE
jgi:hypothetical protein